MKAGARGLPCYSSHPTDTLPKLQTSCSCSETTHLVWVCEHLSGDGLHLLRPGGAPQQRLTVRTDLYRQGGRGQVNLLQFNSTA